MNPYVVTVTPPQVIRENLGDRRVHYAVFADSPYQAEDQVRTILIHYPKGPQRTIKALPYILSKRSPIEDQIAFEQAKDSQIPIFLEP